MQQQHEDKFLIQHHEYSLQPHSVTAPDNNNCNTIINDYAPQHIALIQMLQPISTDSPLCQPTRSHWLHVSPMILLHSYVLGHTPNAVALLVVSLSHEHLHREIAVIILLGRGLQVFRNPVVLLWQTSDTCKM